MPEVICTTGVRGHEIELVSGQDYTWEFENWTCAHCGKAPVDNQDACIAHLPGVKFACCGHGGAVEGYVYFENGVVIRGNFRVSRRGGVDEP